MVPRPNAVANSILLVRLTEKNRINSEPDNKSVELATPDVNGPNARLAKKNVKLVIVRLIQARQTISATVIMRIEPMTICVGSPSLCNNKKMTNAPMKLNSAIQNNVAALRRWIRLDSSGMRVPKLILI